jgi:hypothetical protein
VDTARQAELREYALSLLKEETETNKVRNVAPASRRHLAPFNPLALAFPLFLIGGILWLAFPPMGNTLLIAAALRLWEFGAFLLPC